MQPPEERHDRSESEAWELLAQLREEHLRRYPPPAPYEEDAEPRFRLVPVRAGVTCSNGARLFFLGLEIWPDNNRLHATLLGERSRALFDHDPATGREPELTPVPLLTDSDGRQYHIGSGDLSAEDRYVRASWDFTPGLPETGSLTISFDPTDAWAPEGGDKIVVDLRATPTGGERTP